MRTNLLILAGMALAGLLAWALSTEHSTFLPPERLGPPALVQTRNAPAVWLLQKQEERRQLRGGSGRFSVGNVRTVTWYHFSLTAIDPHTLQPVWQRRLRSVRERDGGHSADAQILGPDGEAIWLYLIDGPVALASEDGSVLLDAAGIEQRNPALAGMLSREAGHYAWFGGLLLMTADARRLLLRLPAGTAEPFAVDESNADAVRRAEFMAQQWNGAYKASDFVVRTGLVGGAWAGLYTASEAAGVARDSWGELLREPERVRDEGSLARRRFWRARIVSEQPWPDRPPHERVAEVLPVAEASEYLQGGMLVRAGTREPLALADPAGVLVLHRTRVDEPGRLVLSRLDENFRAVWRRDLPLAELGQRWELPGTLLLYGSARSSDGQSQRHGEYLVRLDLASGQITTRDIVAGAPL